GAAQPVLLHDRRLPLRLPRPSRQQPHARRHDDARRQRRPLVAVPPDVQDRLQAAALGPLRAAPAPADRDRAADRGGRRLFVDNLRWTMIVLVIGMHAADTYSPFGSWYYADRADTGPATALALGTFQSVLQAFFMGVLFAVAGYFARASLLRKGRA